MKIKPYLEYKEFEIIDLYKAVGWKNYYENPHMLKLAYMNSLYILGSYVNDKLVGIVRVVGDGYSIIYIQDIVVSPLYQRKGIGTALLHDVLNKYSQVYQKVLLTDDQPKTIKFYKSLGFDTLDKFGCLGFVNYTL